LTRVHRSTTARTIFSRRFLVLYYCLLLAGLLLVGSAAFSWYRSQPGPAGGTVLVLVTGRSASRLRAASVDLRAQGSWRRVLGNVSLTVPAAPATYVVARVPTPAGEYDAVRVGPREVPGQIHVTPGGLTPVLIAIDDGQPLGNGVYSGTDGVNLALQELSGQLKQVPAFSLLDQHRRPFTNAALAGHDVVLAAFHTNCTATCPLYTGLFLQLARRLPASTMLVEATTDPWGDTPAALRLYAERIGLRWTLVTGTPGQMEAFWAPFTVQLSGAQLHTSTLALIDRHGYIRTYYQGVPDVGNALPPALESQLGPLGLTEARTHGDGWGANQVLDSLHVIGATDQLPTVGGSPAPDFELHGLGGGQVRLSDFRGRPLVIGFWASWCAPCRRDLPLIEQTLRQHPGVRLLLVDESDSTAAARAEVRQLQVRAPVAEDPDGRAGQLYRVFGLPTTVFVRPDGSIESRFPGELTAQAIDGHVSALV
jgi:cytochrome oxidase Cu insertion factor (SCO1/SenC/PrrC family)/thiol-disulfide isomerase/thioredoxin